MRLDAAKGLQFRCNRGFTIVELMANSGTMTRVASNSLSHAKATPLRAAPSVAVPAGTRTGV